MLGSSTGGVEFAINEGLGFVFASHLAPHLAILVLQRYQINLNLRHLCQNQKVFSRLF